MTRHAVLCIFMALPLTGIVASEPESIIGEWDVVKAIEGGKEVRGNKMTWKISSNTVQSTNNAVMAKYSYSIKKENDVSKIDLSIKNESGETRRHYGLYKFSQGKLHVIIDNRNMSKCPLPADFNIEAATDHGHYSYMIFKKHQ